MADLRGHPGWSSQAKYTPLASTIADLASPRTWACTPGRCSPGPPTSQTHSAPLAAPDASSFPTSPSRTSRLPRAALRHLEAGQVSPGAGGCSWEAAQVRQVRSSTQTIACKEPRAVAGPCVRPASPAVLTESQGRGQHSGAWTVRAPKGPAGAGGGRHRRQGQRGGGDARGAERAASPVRDPGPPASASSSSARVASPGMAWPCARPSVRVSPCVCPVEPVRPPPLARGMGGVSG